MVNFYGNVQLGRDVHMRQLLQSYNGVVLVSVVFMELMVLASGLVVDKRR